MTDVEFIIGIKPKGQYFKNDYSYICYIALYQFAAKYCQHKIVLDAACGMGFGSYFLTRVADQVVGIDLSTQPLTHAKQQYKDSKLSFLINDVTKTAFADNSFDTIVSIETFEHLPPEIAITALNEFRRILKPKGRLVISTPNRLISRQIAQHEDHINEMNVEPFFGLLSDVFSGCEPFYQRKGVFQSMKTFYSVVRTDRFKLRHLIPQNLRNKINSLITPELSESIPDLINKLSVHGAADLEELKDAVIQIALCEK